MKNIIQLTENDLKYIIKESVNKILINEGTALDSLRRYLQMPIEKKKLLNVKLHPHNFIYYLKSVKDIDVSEDIDVNDLVQNYGEYIDEYYQDIQNSFYTTLGDGSVDAEFQNSNLYMTYKGEHNGWLFHFTNNPYEIMKNGFMGLTNNNTIHRTFGYPIGFQRKVGKGLGFAYTLENIPSQNIYRTDYMVIFKSPSISFFHRLDKDVQEVFDVSQVDKNQVYIFKLNNKNGESHYDGSGDRYAEPPTIESMVCCFPQTLKGLTVNTPTEAIQEIEKGTFKSTEKPSNYDETDRIVKYFENIKNVRIRKSMNKIIIDYNIGEGNYFTEAFQPFKPIVSRKYFIGPVVETMKKNGYELKTKNFKTEYYAIICNLYNEKEDVKITVNQHLASWVSAMRITIEF